jgi:hypothetical protein
MARSRRAGIPLVRFPLAGIPLEREIQSSATPLVGSTAQLNATQLNPTQLNPTQLNPTQLNPVTQQRFPAKQLPTVQTFTAIRSIPPVSGTGCDPGLG